MFHLHISCIARYQPGREKTETSSEVHILLLTVLWDKLCLVSTLLRLGRELGGERYCFLRLKRPHKSSGAVSIHESTHTLYTSQILPKLISIANSWWENLSSNQRADCIFYASTTAGVRW